MFTHLCFDFKPDEVGLIKNVFDFYDFERPGKIKRHLALKILQNLGLSPPAENLPAYLTFKDMLLYVDSRCPDPSLEGSLDISFRLASTKTTSTEEANKITPSGVIHFMRSFEKQPPTLDEANALLVTMLPYDDCSLKAEVSQEIYNRYILNMSKNIPPSPVAAPPRKRSSFAGSSGSNMSSIMYVASRKLSSSSSISTDQGLQSPSQQTRR